MTKKYAVVNNKTNIVDNVIVANDDFKPREGFFLVNVDGINVSPKDEYKDGEFISYKKKDDDEQENEQASR